MGRLGDTTINSPSKYGMKSEEEVCRNEVQGTEYRCAVGHCCEDASCCTYYYELWWFWLIWTLIIVMSCCCAYHHRKKRQHLRSRRSRSGASQDPYVGACNYPGPPIDKDILGTCKLPSYEDAARMPPSGSPPPPYRSHRALNTITCIEPDSEGVASMKFLSYNDLTSSVLSLVSSFGFGFGRRDHVDTHCTSTRETRCRYSDDVGLAMMTVDDTSVGLHADIPEYSMEGDVAQNTSVSRQKLPVHIVDCQTVGTMKKDMGNGLPGNIEPDDELQSYLLVDEISQQDKFPKKERQRQDSGIDIEGNFADSTESLSVEKNCGCESNDETSTEMLPRKRSEFVKQFEKTKLFFSKPVKLGTLPTRAVDDSSSSDDDDDYEPDHLHYNLDFNNNTGSSNTNFSGEDVTGQETYCDENAKKGDFVIRLTSLNSDGSESSSLFPD